MGNYSKKGGNYSKKRYLGGKRSKKGKGTRSRLQSGGMPIRPVFVGAPWNGSDTNTWGTTNHFALNPEGSGSGDPLNQILNTREVTPHSMMGGKKHHRKTKKHGKKSKSKKSKKHSKKYYKGKKSKTHRGKDFSTRRKSKMYNEKRFKKMFGRKTLRAPIFSYAGGKKRMKGGYQGDMFFQNGVNLLRNVGTGLGNIAHGLEGYPPLDSPMPVYQPDMVPGPRPIPHAADIEGIYKAAQSQVGAISPSTA